MLIQHSHELIEDELLAFEEHAFTSCTLRRCTLRVSGIEDEIILVDTDLLDCTFCFVGPAARGLAFLSHMYFQPGGAPLVESFFSRIRQGAMTSDEEA